MVTGLLNNLKVDVSAVIAKMPAFPANVKSSEASMVAAGVVGTITAIQLLTEWDPVGRCFTFWSQLRNHVSAPKKYNDGRRRLGTGPCCPS
jgi:hypothetical protein